MAATGFQGRSSMKISHRIEEKRNLASYINDI